jgi:hypothetical protein
MSKLFELDKYNIDGDHVQYVITGPKGNNITGESFAGEEYTLNMINKALRRLNLELTSAELYALGGDIYPEDWV